MLFVNSYITPRIKHKIIGQQAFTEDGILIYNISTYMPKKATVPEIYKYFQKFGRVLDVRFLEIDELEKCFIHLAEPKVAAKILQKKHVFMGCEIHVEACNSFDQPDGQTLIKLLDERFKTDSTAANGNDCNSLNKTEQEALILSLNDNCLEHICKKLDLADQINFGLTCQRFYDILVMISNVNHENLNAELFEKWTLFKTRIFLQIIGPKIKNLRSSWFKRSDYFGKNVLEFLGSFCANVEEFRAYQPHPPDAIQKLIENMHLLQRLHLFRVPLSSKFMKQSNTLNNLKSLGICDDFDVTGKNIHLLSGLEKLSLKGCTQLTPCHFKKICKNLTNLHYLDIRGCEELNTNDYQHISKYLLQLKTLKLSCSYGNFICLAELPNLTALEIYCKTLTDNTLLEEFLENLAKHRANQLEELKLTDILDTNLRIATSVAALKKLKVLHCTYSALEDTTLTIFSHLTELEDVQLTDCTFITDDIALQLLQNCLKVKKISLDHSHSLTSDFLYKAAQLLQEQRGYLLRTDRVRMCIYPRECICKNFARDDFSNVLAITCIPRLLNYEMSKDPDYDDFEYIWDDDYDNPDDYDDQDDHGDQEDNGDHDGNGGRYWY